MTDRWYDKTIAQTETNLKTDIRRGLSDFSVKAHRKRYGKNQIYPSRSSSFGGYLKQIVTDYLSLLLLATIIIAAIFEESAGTLIMAVILIVYYIFAIFSYIRAYRILEGMGSYSKPNARVLRDGKLYMISQENVVPGDILVLEAGDIIPCDARLISSDELDVLETSITGVPKAQRKDADFIDYHDIAPAAQLNMLFATTIVTHGKGKAIACVTGEDTLVCKMKKNISPVSDDRLAIFDTMGGFCKKWTLFMSAAVILLTGANLLVSAGKQGIFGIFLTSLSLAVASMSEFYTAFVYIILACGIFNAVKHYGFLYAGAIIKNSSKIEQLKDLSCLIVPKDEAFIVPDLHIIKVYADGVENYITERTFAKHSSRTMTYALLSTGLYGSNRILIQSEKGGVINPEEQMIVSFCDRMHLSTPVFEKKYSLVEHVESSEKNRFETTLIRTQTGYQVAVRGDYAKILASCRYYTENGKVFEMTRDKRNEFLVTASMMVKDSCRVIAVASKETIYNNLRKLIACQSDMVFEGFIAASRPMLPEVAKNVSRCLSAGIKVIMLCDEADEENRYLAETLGIIRSEDQILSGYALSRMNESDFMKNVSNYRVYVGLTASQKYAVLKCLSSSGENVGFLGSGLNAIALLRQAEVGFAQSVTTSPRSGSIGIDVSGRGTLVKGKKTGSGCESLKFISDVIISEPDKDGNGGFNAIVDSILCSRVIFMNLSRMIRYMMTSQCARFVLVFLSIIFGKVYLNPTQILFCGLIVDFIAVLTIANEKPSQDMLYLQSISLTELLTPFKSNVVPVIYGLIWAVLGFYVPIFLQQYGIITTELQCSAVTFALFIITQVFVLLESKKEKSLFVPNVRINKMLTIAILILSIIMVAIFTFEPLSAIFGISSIPPLALCGVLIAPVIMLIVYEISKLLMPKE